MQNCDYVTPVVTSRWLIGPTVIFYLVWYGMVWFGFIWFTWYSMWVLSIHVVPCDSWSFYLQKWLIYGHYSHIWFGFAWYSLVCFGFVWHSMWVFVYVYYRVKFEASSLKIDWIMAIKGIFGLVFVWFSMYSFDLVWFYMI